MTDTMIPAGMTEKEYFEIHASQEEFLDWYYKQELPQYEKPSVTVDMVAYCFGGFMDKGEDASHACQREVKEEVNLELPLEKIEQLMTVSTPGRDPRGWTVTIAHLVYLPSRALELVQAGDDAKDVVFVDVDFQTGKCFLKGVELEDQAFAFDHYAIIQESIKRIQGRLDWNPTFLYLLEEEFTVYEGTELVNLINPGRPIVSNNFLVKYGEYVEEVGLKRVPKKKPRKTYRLK